MTSVSFAELLEASLYGRSVPGQIDFWHVVCCVDNSSVFLEEKVIPALTAEFKPSNPWQARLYVLHVDANGRRWATWVRWDAANANWQAYVKPGRFHMEIGDDDPLNMAIEWWLTRSLAIPMELESSMRAIYKQSLEDDDWTPPDMEQRKSQDVIIDIDSPP